MRSFARKEVYKLDWSPKGDLPVTAGLESKMAIWDTRQGNVLREIDAPSWVINVQFTADGSRLLSACADEGMGTVNRKVVVGGLDDPVT